MFADGKISVVEMRDRIMHTVPVRLTGTTVRRTSEWRRDRDRWFRGRRRRRPEVDFGPQAGNGYGLRCGRACDPGHSASLGQKLPTGPGLHKVLQYRVGGPGRRSTMISRKTFSKPLRMRHRARHSSSDTRLSHFADAPQKGSSFVAGDARRLGETDRSGAYERQRRT